MTRRLVQCGRSRAHGHVNTTRIIMLMYVTSRRARVSLCSELLPIYAGIILLCFPSPTMLKIMPA